EPEEDREGHDEQQPGAVFIPSPAELAPAPPEPGPEEGQADEGQETRRARLEPPGPERGADVEPPDREQAPDERRPGADRRGKPPSRVGAGHQEGRIPEPWLTPKLFP